VGPRHRASPLGPTRRLRRGRS